MYKWFWSFCIVAGISLVALAIYLNDNHAKWQEKCQAAGGVPSRYSVMIGKTNHTEYACLHPSAIINLE